MAETAVSFLLEQLSSVLRDEGKLLGGLKHEVQCINDELVSLRRFLRVADAGEEETHLRDWVGQLREISFDVQDLLDEYILRFGRHRSTTGFLKKFTGPIKNLKAQHQIASEIRKIKTRLENVIGSLQKYRDMYAAVGQEPAPKAEKYDDALFLEEDEVLGIEGPRKQLLKWIASMRGGVGVVSVVGMGGLGKTTLVKKVYDDDYVRHRYDRRAWLVVSDYKDVRNLLISLAKKFAGETKEALPPGLEVMGVDDIRNHTCHFLRGTKYVIVLDDVWESSTWDIIRPALPARGSDGCVIITTRSRSVADADHVYSLEPFSPEDSALLFFKKAFPRNPCPPYIREFAQNILRKCGGLPLAIVVIGGLLARKEHTVEDWGMLSRSLISESNATSLDRLRRLFSLSYNDLPHNLRYCFLYLSVFPEGGVLEKEKILRMWTAEGFVQAEPDRTLEEVAEKYLDELCSRSLVQVAEKHIDGRSKRLRVHDLMRDYIASEAKEHNIVTISKGEEQQWWPNNKMRRLAVHSSAIAFPVERNSFEHLRSLLLSDGDVDMGVIRAILNRCKLLKVLDLRGAPIDAIPTEVFKLYHLKHLCLRDTAINRVQKSIKRLRNLETLDLKNTNVTQLPRGILKLSKLRQLLVYKYSVDDHYKIAFGYREGFGAPYEIGSCLHSLQKLCYVEAGAAISTVKEIGKLTQLRRLGIVKVRRENGGDLRSSLAKLNRLRSLVIASTGEGELLDIDPDSSPSAIRLPFLRTLSLYGRLERVPRWIPSLSSLSILQLGWSKLKEDPLIWLEDLPNLEFMLIKDACVEGLCFRARGFQKLKSMRLGELRTMSWVVVEEGSMPLLRQWTVCECELLEELPGGIEHLANLDRVDFHDMPVEFRDKVVEEQRREGDGWRLAGLRYVGFSVNTNGRREHSNIVTHLKC